MLYDYEDQGGSGFLYGDANTVFPKVRLPIGSEIDAKFPISGS